VVGAVGLMASCILTACGVVSSGEPREGRGGARVAAADVGGAGKSKDATERETRDEKSKTASSDKSIGFVAAALGATAAEEARGSCRPGMVSIEGRYCIDRYEASLVEVLPDGSEQRFSPFSTVADHHVRAVSEGNVFPQGYISATQAERACAASGKRLCKVAEWQQACRGPEDKRYGYAEQRVPGRCNDKGRNPVVTLFGFRYDASTMNQPQLNQLDGTLARTGEHAGCSNGYGVYDMVGNLHEWVADPNGTFYGGYYQDVASVGHGDGCSYQTTAHEARYHDYSTGFRCCADPLDADLAPASPPSAKNVKTTSRPAPRWAPKKRK
jgi:formylglycine-generating enzyme